MPRPKRGMTRRNMFMSDKSWKKLEVIATKREVTISDLVRQAIQEFLAKKGESNG